MNKKIIMLILQVPILLYLKTSENKSLKLSKETFKRYVHFGVKWLAKL